MFENVTTFPADPILGLAEVFKKDDSANKINLSIGLYHGEDGKVPQLASVAKARDIYFKNESGASLYLPIDGIASFGKAVNELIFEKDAKAVVENRLATMQTLGGSGALSMGATFLRDWFPNSTVSVSNPTWGNHISIFEHVGFEVKKYPYYNQATNGVDFEAMTAYFNVLPAKSIVLLHPCCHNPTGADLTPAQWDTLIEIIQKRDLIPFLDIAYMGMGGTIEEDTYAIRAMEKAGLMFLVSFSFSKIFSVYGERVGALAVVCENTKTQATVLSQLKGCARKIYSTPPAYGAHLVDIVLNNPELKALWLEELTAMRQRILEMRQLLFDKMMALGNSEAECSFIIQQKGMFSFTGFSKEQVVALRETAKVYLIENGRMCVAGLTSTNVETVAEAFAKVALVNA